MSFVRNTRQLSTPSLEIGGLAAIVYPNPARDLIFIETTMSKMLTINNEKENGVVPSDLLRSFFSEETSKTPQSVCIMSMSGQLLLEVSQADQIDISHLPIGTYIVRIQVNDGFVYRKLLKQ